MAKEQTQDSPRIMIVSDGTSGGTTVQISGKSVAAGSKKLDEVLFMAISPRDTGDGMGDEGFFRFKASTIQKDGDTENISTVRIANTEDGFKVVVDDSFVGSQKVMDELEDQEDETDADDGSDETGTETEDGETEEKEDSEDTEDKADDESADDSSGEDTGEEVEDEEAKEEETEDAAPLQSDAEEKEVSDEEEEEVEDEAKEEPKLTRKQVRAREVARSFGTKR